MEPVTGEELLQIIPLGADGLWNQALSASVSLSIGYVSIREGLTCLSVPIRTYFNESLSAKIKLISFHSQLEQCLVSQCGKTQIGWSLPIKSSERKHSESSLLLTVTVTFS